MSPAIVTNTGRVVDVEYNDVADRFILYSVNMDTGKFVGVLNDDEFKTIETNSLGVKTNQFPFYAVGEINGSTLAGDTDEEKTIDCFNKLKALL